MKFSLKLCLATLALVCFGVAIGMFAVSFLDQVTAGVLNGKGSWGTGFDILGSDLDASNKLGTIFALVFVIIGALSSLYGVFFALQAGKKKSKGNKMAKYVCACSTFVICGLVPALLLFLTKQTTGVGLDVKTVLGSTETTLGIGAILAALLSLVGGCSLSLAELSK